MPTARSRKGCINCKQAKVKCDEVHPSCGTCVRRARQCKGYSCSLSPTTTVSPQASITTPAAWIVSGYSGADTIKTLDDSLLLFRHPSFIPLTEILAADKPFIEVYFMRHPSDLVISSTFVDEMNAVVISLMQQSPVALSDALSAIGEIYLKDTATSSAVEVSSRKTRLLSRLRTANEDGGSLELILVLLLGLCGVELVDPQSDGRGNTLSALVENMSLMLEFHMRAGKELNETEKYLTRAVARQDLLISLSRMQRTKISPYIWLDGYSMSHADRFMGYTTTLAPILSELCTLAEDVQSIIDAHSVAGVVEMSVEPDALIYQQHASLADRKAEIQAQLYAWRPLHESSMSMQASRKFILHAYAWRAAALLYLLRLFDRPGSSMEADQAALDMAYEVMVHISGPAEEIKLSLWPLFIAACELRHQEDRHNARQLFDSICRARPTVTAKRTRWFCLNQIWPARDEGRDWDWMQLRRLDMNDFVPI